MYDMPPSKSSRPARAPGVTRQAIIEAGGELFADRGFAGVTAREVAQRAGASLSAIPYHFGSMEALYRETLRAACQISQDAAPLAAQALLAPPDRGLRMAVLWAIMDTSASANLWAVRLFYREELDPSPAYRELLDLKIVPEWNWLREVVARAARRKAESLEVKFGVVAMYSVVAPLHLHRGMIPHLAPDLVSAIAADREALVELVARLTLDAVERCAESLTARKPVRRQAKPRKRVTRP
jgi:AcrR family transcriptional regulator